MPGIIETPRGALTLYGVSGAPTKADAPRGNGCRDWIRATRQASFKGVPFEVAEVTKSGGRRLAVHTYPNRDTYDVEDLGRDVVVYQVSGYVIGDWADANKDLLFSACSADAGPGLLVLPLGIPVTAWLSKVQATDVMDEMGRIPMAMEFIEQVTPQGGLFSTAFHQNVISGKAGKAAEAINTGFSLAFDTVVRAFSTIDFVPAIARVASADEINRVAEALDRARLGVKIGGTKNDPAHVEFAIRRMRQDARDLAYRGQRPNRYKSDTFIADQTVIKSGLTALVSDSVRRIAELGDTPEAAYASVATMAGYTAAPIERAISGIARSERAETVLTAEIGNLLRRHAIVRLADVATRRRFRTRQDAAQTKADLSQAFQAELAGIRDPSLSEPMEEVMQATADYLSDAANQAPSAVRVRATANLPACVAAYQLYKDSSKGRDLIELNNRSIHPLFMPSEFEAPLDLGRKKRKGH